MAQGNFIKLLFDARVSNRFQLFPHQLIIEVCRYFLRSDGINFSAYGPPLKRDANWIFNDLYLLRIALQTYRGVAPTFAGARAIE